MKLYSKGKNYTLYQGSMLELLDVIAENTVDAVVCDPPYELNFMNKGWDNSGIAFQKETWEKCLKALKPGGYLLAFGGSRTFHRIACAIEDAGFEIRDTVMWLYGSGFPKSLNIGKSVESKLVNGSANTQEFKKLKGTKAVADSLGFTKMQHEHGARPNDYSIDGNLRTVDVDYQTEDGKKWDGWGTALKPSYEPIIVARKPCEGSCVANILKYGVGGINIDECRVGTEERTYKGMSANIPKGAGCFRDDEWKPKDIEKKVNGRFPANTILTYDDTDFEEVCGGMPNTKGSATERSRTDNDIYGKTTGGILQSDVWGDSGSAARYFYCAKASKRDRDDGLNGKRNTHCTVKPTDLMQYLVRLVTPNGGTVLDPFNGSGSTGKAVMYENKDRNKDYKYIGIELSEEYLEISNARIEYVCGVEEVQEEVQEERQMTVFDFVKKC